LAMLYTRNDVWGKIWRHISKWWLFKAMCILPFFETNSVIKTQRRWYRTQYGNDPPSDNAIRRWLKQFQETGSVLHRKGAERPSTSQENVDRIQGNWMPLGHLAC
jgi:hypothetical protein